MQIRKIETTKVFKELTEAVKSGYTTILELGGSRSGKTYNTLIWLVCYSLLNDTEIAIVRRNLTTIMKTVYKDLIEVLSLLDVPYKENKMTKIVSIGHSKIMFLGTDDPQKLRGFHSHIVFVNEATEVSYDAICQLRQRMTGFMICDFNPTYSSDFWINRVRAEKKTYFFKTVFSDNPFISDVAKAQILQYKETNPDYWKIYGEGEAIEKKGLIYQFTEVEDLPFEGQTIIGLDFGFANDPTAAVKVVVDTKNKRLYLRELLYRLGLLNKLIVEALSPYKGIKIYADCAEPKTIKELLVSGLNVVGCKKTKSKTELIMWCKGWDIYADKNSIHLLTEFRNYSWDVDYNECLLNTPIDEYDHLMDAFRYAVFTSQNKGVYNISFR